ncbi:MAG: 5-formyltetrahydrofolate cyclo-ligase [Thermodesulfobacteriota bacterium]
MAVSVQKAHLREESLQRRVSISFEEASRVALIIQKKLELLPEFVEADRLALYAGLGNEVHTDYLFSRALELQKEVSYPRVDTSIEGGELEFIKVESIDELAPGLYGVPEPKGSGKVVDAGEFDLIIVPGVVFDTFGARIGYGKGYYDKVLKGFGCAKAALAYDMQVLDEPIPTEVHDVNMNVIVTESRVLRF